MLTISHLTIITSLIFLILAFYQGVKAGENPSIFLPLFLYLGLAVLIALSTWFVFHPICFYLKLCAQTHDMNIYHPLIPVIYFPVFWVAYLVGLIFRPSKKPNPSFKRDA